MDFKLFNPINRKWYIVGVIVLSITTAWFTSVVFPGGQVLSQSIPRLAFPIFLLFGLIELIWDYKRIIDISPRNNNALVLLVIPFGKIAVTIFNVYKAQETLGDGTLLVGINAITISFFTLYKFVLIFRDTYKSNKPPLETKI